MENQINKFQFMQGPVGYIKNEQIHPDENIQDDIIIILSAIVNTETREYSLIKMFYNTGKHTLEGRRINVGDFIFLQVGEFEKLQIEFALGFVQNGEIEESTEVYKEAKMDAEFVKIIEKGFADFNKEGFQQYYNVQIPQTLTLKWF